MPGGILTWAGQLFFPLRMTVNHAAQLNHEINLIFFLIEALAGFVKFRQYAQRITVASVRRYLGFIR